MPEIDLVAERGRPSGLYQLVLLKFVRNRVALFGLCCLLLLLLAILFAPQVTPYDPIGKNTPERNQPPSRLHPFGTDKLGRDIMSRVLYGGRVSLQVGFLSVGLAVLVSTPLGLIAGFFGGAADNVIMRVMDLILAFPGLILAIWLVSLLGSNKQCHHRDCVFLAADLFALDPRHHAVDPRDGVCDGGARHGRGFAAHHVFPHLARCAGSHDRLDHAQRIGRDCGRRQLELPWLGRAAAHAGMGRDAG